MNTRCVVGCGYYGAVTHALNRYINHAPFALISSRFRAIVIRILRAGLCKLNTSAQAAAASAYPFIFPSPPSPRHRELSMAFRKSPSTSTFLAVGHLSLYQTLEASVPTPGAPGLTRPGRPQQTVPRTPSCGSSQVLAQEGSNGHGTEQA